VLGAYVRDHGIEDPQAAKSIREAFAQRNLLPGFDRPYDAAASGPGVLQRERSTTQLVGAQVLKMHADAEGLKKVFTGGDTISSILPQYLDNRIPSFDRRGEAPVIGRERFHLQTALLMGHCFARACARVSGLSG
jgi:hypothetical protein